MNVKVIDVLSRIMGGFGFTAIITFVTLTALLVNGIEPQLADIWKKMLGSMIMGAFFGLASYLFQVPHWSPLRQIATHFSLSIIIFFPIAIWVEWLPAKPLPLLIGLLTFMAIYACFWASFAFYYRREIKDLNNKINDK